MGLIIVLIILLFTSGNEFVKLFLNWAKNKIAKHKING